MKLEGSECRESSTDAEWTAAGLRTRQRRIAVSRHPGTGEKVFFNQIQLHHVSCLGPEVRTETARPSKTGSCKS